MGRESTATPRKTHQNSTLDSAVRAPGNEHGGAPLPAARTTTLTAPRTATGADPEPVERDKVVLVAEVDGWGGRRALEVRPGREQAAMASGKSER